MLASQRFSTSGWRSRTISSALLSTARWTIVIMSSLVSGLGVNRTIDDENGDIVTGFKIPYQGIWNYGPDCSDCKLQPDPTSATQNTWHIAQLYPKIDNGLNPPRNFTLMFSGKTDLARTLYNVEERMQEPPCMSMVSFQMSSIHPCSHTPI